jgi:hypothetical protein
LRVGVQVSQLYDGSTTRVHWRVTRCRYDPGVGTEDNLDLELFDQRLLEPWDRQVGEGPKAYAAFLTYRELPAGTRSTRRCVPLHYGSEFTDDHPSFRAKWKVLQHWCARYEWVERCCLWDAHQSIQLAAQRVYDVQRMRDRHAAIATIALEKASERLSTLDPDDMGVHDLVKLIDLGVKVERLSRGDPDAIIRHTGTGGSYGDRYGTQRGDYGSDRLNEVVAILEQAAALPEGTADAFRRHWEGGTADGDGYESAQA